MNSVHSAFISFEIVVLKCLKRKTLENSYYNTILFVRSFTRIKQHRH